MTTQGEQGFTLIELLVSVTLVSLLTVLLFGGLRFGTRSADAVGRRIDASSDVALVYDFMQTQLANAQPMPMIDNSKADAVSFDGEPTTLIFVGLPPFEVDLGGYQRLTVSVAEKGTNKRLVADWRQIARGPLAAGAKARRPSVLMDDVKSVRFAYYGQYGANRPLSWGDRWHDRRTLPQLVRVSITLADGRHVPDLVIAPRLAGPAQL